MPRARADAVIVGGLRGLEFPPAMATVPARAQVTITARKTGASHPRGPTRSHLDVMAAAGPPADLVAAFALPTPSLVICELLGVPPAERTAFQDRTARLLDLSRTDEERARASAESRTYMATLVEKAEADPGEDMIGMLLREHGNDITRAELISIASLLLGAGHETTANMLALGSLALLCAPDQLAVESA